MQNAWKVGLMVIVFAALVIASYSFLGRQIFAPKPLRLQATFADAGGVTPGAKVQMAGVTIGSVESLQLDSPTRAVAVLAIQQGIEVPAGSSAVIGGSLIGLGDSPIQIVPPERPDGRLAKEGDVLPGRKLGPLDSIAPDLGPTLTATLQELNKTLASTRDLLGDEGIRGELVTVLEKTSRTLDSFSALAGNATATLNENRASIQTALRTFAGAMKDVERSAQLASDLLADPKYKDQADKILASLTETAERANDLMKSASDLVGDPKVKQTLDESMANIRTITDTGTRVAENSEKITSNGVTASENVVELTKKVNALADDARAVLDRLTKFFEKPGRVNPLALVETQADILRETSPGRFRSDFNARTPIPNGAVHFGIWDAFESNKINLQLGRPLGKSGEYRYGMYGGQPGLGVDLPFAPRTRLRGDLYGLNDPRLDIRAQIDFRSDFLGLIGIHRVGDRNQLMVGIGIRK